VVKVSKERKTPTYEDNVIEYKPVYTRPFNVQYVRIDEILNIPVFIKDFTIEKFNDREVIHILLETLDSKEIATRTSSRVLIKQLMPFESAFKAGKKLKAKIIKRKRYYTLAPP
jgi:hypothetical protein